MPSKSKKQHRFMAMCAHRSGRRWAKANNVKCPPLKVALEFIAADKKKRPARHKGRRA